jgi:hypothetical protein
MRIWITKQPTGPAVKPFPVSSFRVGEVYDVGPQLAARLVTAGYAVPEIRTGGPTKRDAHKKRD